MQQEQERPPPPAYTQTEPDTLHLPSVPTNLIPNPPHNDRLPGIRSLDLPVASPTHFARPFPSRASLELSPKNAGDSMQWPSLPPLTSSNFPRVPRTSTDSDIGSPMDTASVVSTQDDAGSRREMSVSVDDPDVRLAAEALSGLGNPDFVRSPTARSHTMSRDSSDPEPLLSLITTNHPWLGGTINGSITAYNMTKGYSPRIVKYGAELIERNIGSPMVNTVSTVGRRTGVEKNLRRYLGEVRRRPSDLEQGDEDGAHKRQRIRSPGSDAMDIEEGHPSPRMRGDSQSSYAETLPAYDDQRSPQYEETSAVSVDPATGKETEPRSGASQDRRVNWSTQLIITTSGLGVALSETSLRSLKLCLGLLRSANQTIDQAMRRLKSLLEEYESTLRNQRQGQSTDAVRTDDEQRSPLLSPSSALPAEEEQRVRRIADLMKTLSSEIWKTLQNVVQYVSRHAGGALPDNAAQVVRTQLLSVPQRWQSADRSSAQEQNAGDEVRGVNRMLAFAKEGLDMISQITIVVDGTVQSADSWLDRFGRKHLQGGSGGEPSASAQGHQQQALPEKMEIVPGGGGGGGEAQAEVQVPEKH